MRSRLVVTLVALLVLVPGTARSLQIVSHNEHYDPLTQVFQFTLQLSAPPDLFTVDEFNRGQDEFQYWITYDLPADPFYPLVTPDVLIRGSEIRWSGGIPVRERTGGDGGPHTGGWGPIRGIVPYQLIGSVITFSIPRELLGDPDGKFAYFLMVLVYGSDVDHRMGVSDGPEAVPVLRTSWGSVKRMYR